MFKYSAFIRKNTQELRDKLEGMGYRDNSMYGYGNSWDYDCLSTNGNISEYDECDDDQIDWDTVENRIDCGTNEEAFLAIAAIRDDTDVCQYFKSNDKNDFYYHYKFLKYSKTNDDAFRILIEDKCHKATPQEILEYFKNK